MILGSHISIADGLGRAVEKAAALGFDAMALFVRNQLQWAVPPLGEDAVSAFRRARRRCGISPVVAHGSYLVNLAGADDVRARSVAAVAADLARCGRLGIEYLVIHPGSHPDADEGIRRIAAGIDAAFADVRNRRVKLLLETTAGAGNTIGRTFEQLAAILAASRRGRRLGVCLDTCHAFAAGYDLRSPRAYEKTMNALDGAVGLGRLLALHVNDSKGPPGSRRDRHEHIGRGRIGRRGFRNVVNDPRLADVPLILETPKGTDEATGRDRDELNRDMLRGLLR